MNNSLSQFIILFFYVIVCINAAEGNWIKMYDTSCRFLELDIIILLLLLLLTTLSARDFPLNVDDDEYGKIIECELISHCIELTHQRRTKKKTGNDSAY